MGSVDQAPNVDISADTADARSEAARWADDDPTYAEVMATLAELGDLLDSGRADEDYRVECRALVDRSVGLGKQHGYEVDELEALWWARQMGDRS